MISRCSICAFDTIQPLITSIRNKQVFYSPKIFSHFTVRNVAKHHRYVDNLRCYQLKLQFIQFLLYNSSKSNRWRIQRRNLKISIFCWLKVVFTDILIFYCLWCSQIQNFILHRPQSVVAALAALAENESGIEKQTANLRMWDYGCHVRGVSSWRLNSTVLLIDTIPLLLLWSQEAFFENLYSP